MRFLNEATPQSSIDKFHNPQAILKIALMLLLMFFSMQLTAQSVPLVESDLSTTQNNLGAINIEQNVSSLWGLVIGMLVLFSAGSVAYLCYFSMHVWSGYWKTFAFAPLAILGVWLAIIIIAKLFNPLSHSLWAFEVFAWAMGALIYLVILMTAKRTFDKSAQTSLEND